MTTWLVIRLWAVRGRLAVRRLVRAAGLGTVADRPLVVFVAASAFALVMLAAVGTVGLPAWLGVPVAFAAVVGGLLVWAVALGGPADVLLEGEADRLADEIDARRTIVEAVQELKQYERSTPTAAEIIVPLELVPLPVEPPPAGDWLKGDGTFPLAAAGESYYQRPLDAVCHAAGRDADAILRLDDNPHDRYAVSVLVAGRKVGQLSRDDARAFRLRVAGEGRIGPEFPCRARISGDRGAYTVRLDVRLR